MTRPSASQPRPPIYRVVEDVTPDVVAAFVREAITEGYRTVYLHPSVCEMVGLTGGGILDVSGCLLYVLSERTLPCNALWALDEDPPAVPWEAP